MPKTIEKPTRIERLDKILSPNEMRVLGAKIRELNAEGIQPLDPIYIGRIRELFQGWRASLEARGVLPEYLAYAVAYAIRDKRKARAK